jgi:hypothetical protein
MGLPAQVRERAEEHIALFCANRIPEHVQGQVRLEHSTRGTAITIHELRAPWREDMGAEWTRQQIAQLRFDPDTGLWSLYWMNNGWRWLPYDGLPPASDVGPLLAEVGEDPAGCFWG